MIQPLAFEVHNRAVRCTVAAGYNAGYTGRNHEEVEAHITELRHHGVQAPDNIPTLFSIPSYMNLQVDAIEVEHARTSGEVEWALIFQGPTAPTLLTVASDHTDRALEAHDVTASKQISPNVLGSQAWDLNQLTEEVDDIVMRSKVFRSGKWTLLQEGTMGDLISPFDWLDRLRALKRLRPGVVLLGGTVPLVHPDAQFADRWEVSLERRSGEMITRTYNLHYMEPSIG